jgi:aldose 1-epimerase
LTYDDGYAIVSLRDPDSGRSVELAADDAHRWLQVFSGDTLGTRARESLAVEPMTCPPNAFNSGVDLIVLEPGEHHSAAFSIR